jgi:hypothetical protein
VQQPRITTSLKNAKKFIEADQLEVSDGVAHGWAARELRVRFTGMAAAQITVLMPYPRVWNEERVWTINVGAQSPVVWFLRSQVPFLMRLVSQWAASGPVCVQL